MFFTDKVRVFYRAEIAVHSNFKIRVLVFHGHEVVLLSNVDLECHFLVQLSHECLDVRLTGLDFTAREFKLEVRVAVLPRGALHTENFVVVRDNCGYYVNVFHENIIAYWARMACRIINMNFFCRKNGLTSRVEEKERIL